MCYTAAGLGPGRRLSSETAIVFLEHPDALRACGLRGLADARVRVDCALLEALATR